MLDGNELLAGLSKYIGDADFPEGSVSTAVGTTTTLVDTLLERYGDDYLTDRYLRITANVAGNQYLVRRVSDFDTATGTLTVAPAFPGTTGISTSYELHRYSPSEKFSALDEARISAYPALGLLVVDDTTTGDGVQRVFDIPASIRRGPVEAFEEVPVAVGQNWNYAGDPFGEQITKFTATGCTPSLKAWDGQDFVVPKYMDSNATRLSVAASTPATYVQVVANMNNGITAATVAGRWMTHAKWVYCTTPNTVRLGLQDDNGIIYGAFHQGGGWELIYVEKLIYGANATTLSTILDIASTLVPAVYFWQHEWLYFGEPEKVVESWTAIPIPVGGTDRDDRVQQVALGRVPRGRQIRFKGRSPLQSLGTDEFAQATNTMDIDEFEAQILYAEAAKVLFRRGILSSSAMAELAGPAQVNEAALVELKQKWAQSTSSPQMRSMWG